MYKDFKDLLSAFHAHSVKYLIVGGYAVSFHSQPRATKDIDIFIEASDGNARAVYAALSAFGAPVENMSAADFADPQYFVRFGREPLAVDIMPRVDGLNFDDAWGRRVESPIESEAGLKILFVSRDDLIASKLAAGRLRDLADAADIRNSAERSGE